MADRMVQEAHWGYHDFVIPNAAVVEKGHLAVIDTGNAGVVIKPTVDTGLIPLGIFMESFTGDGVRTCQVKLHRELQATWWANDTGTAVVAADRGKVCYFKDSQTVTGDSTGASIAGVVLDVSAAKGVLVAFNFPWLS